jgi:hypothetical protein
MLCGVSMSESGKTNIEAATELHKASARELPHIGSRTHITLEVIEALVLALVAITTAWSGYEAARWDGVQSERYGRSFRMRIEGQALELKANQERMYDAATVVEWIKAEASSCW